MINGIINVYKEKGYTSHDVVAKLRGILKQKKIGHTGTLDPQAEGVLPVCLGKATRVCGLLTDKDKVYEAVLLLGCITDTQDLEGNVLEEHPVNCSEEEAERAIHSFAGEYQQVPPMYSALKVNGKKLCDLARAGIEVERKARTVEIYRIEILSMELPRVKMRVHCSKGTYIRTLCHDIGASLGCGGCMESLLRTRVADFALEDAKRLSEIEAYVQHVCGTSTADRINAGNMELDCQMLSEIVVPVDAVFAKQPRVTVKEGFEKALYNGNPLKTSWLSGWKPGCEEGQLRVYDKKERFIGIYQFDEKRKDVRPVKIFME